MALGTNGISRKAIVSTSARLGIGVQIDDFAIIHAGVILHDRVVVRSHAVIGSPAEKDGFLDKPGMGVEIGEGTHVSEHVTIHSGIIRKTTIGKNCFLLTKSHIGHCAIIGDGVTISCAVLVGGESIVGNGANLGLGAILHQKANVGSWAMVGANSFVPKNRRIIPGNVYIGSPIRFLKKNLVGLKRAGINDDTLFPIIAKYNQETPGWTAR